MIGYFETSFLPLKTFTGLDDLQDQFDSWTTGKAFVRHHRRVGARVGDALNVERDYLHRLPDPLPATDRHLEVRVSKDCFIRVGEVDYSVPPHLVGRKVAVKASLRALVVHLDGKEIARHARSYVPADVVMDSAHVRAPRLSREARAHLRTGRRLGRGPRPVPLRRARGGELVTAPSFEVAYPARALKMPRIDKAATVFADRARDEGLGLRSLSRRGALGRNQPARRERFGCPHQGSALFSDQDAR